MGKQVRQFTRIEIRDEILKFVGNEKPEFWAYYADYDWVVLCQLFGTMMDLPKGWPMYCRDIKQLCDDLGNPRLPKQHTEKHDSLNDAVWVKESYEFLMNLNVPAFPNGECDCEALEAVHQHEENEKIWRS